MNNPKISIILIYNNESELEKCIKSIQNQSFSDTEIICINNGSQDSAENIVKELSKNDNRIKLISLPVANEIDMVKKTGLGIASGDFVCFIQDNKVLDIDFIKDLYINITSTSSINIQDKHLYRRTYLENDKEISQLIEEKINSAFKNSLEEFDNKKNELQEEFNNFTKNNIEAINNANYELVQRFNQLEKLFYDKEYEYKKRFEEYSKAITQETDAKIKQVYEDISKVYEYINSEINQKGSEINKVYEDITKNYQYTENLVSEKIKEINETKETAQVETQNKINELEKEIITRYVNLKRLMDIQNDETDSKLMALNPSDLSCFKNAVDTINIEKTLSDNMEKIYSHINQTSSLFYEELSKMYKEINEKLLKINQDK